MILTYNGYNIARNVVISFTYIAEFIRSRQSMKETRGESEAIISTDYPSDTRRSTRQIDDGGEQRRGRRVWGRASAP